MSARHAGIILAGVIAIASISVGVPLLLAQGPGGNFRPPGGGPPGGLPHPLLRALDTNHDGIISAEEMANASTALKALDRNGDGQLTIEEIEPPMRGGGPRGPGGGGEPQVETSDAAAQQPTATVLSALPTEKKIASFASNVRVSVSGADFVVESNGLPTHPTDDFPTAYNPNRILKQDYHFHIPLEPKFAAKPTKLPFGPIGVAVNGIPFYNPYNAEGRDAVMGPNAEVFDSCCGHPDQMGRYHYHKYPICARSPFHDEPGQHSPLLGWAFDGFALYGPNGENGQPPTDLDECNGHTDATRGYHYHVTQKFPYLLGSYKGVVDMANFGDHRVWGGRPPSRAPEDSTTK